MGFDDLRRLAGESWRYLPALWLTALEKLNEQVIRSGNHNVSESRFLANGVSKLKPFCFHSNNQTIEIVSLDP